MSDAAATFERLILKPGEFVLLIPKTRITGQRAHEMLQRIPEELRGRVLIVDGFDVKVGTLAERAGKNAGDDAGPAGHPGFESPTSPAGTWHVISGESLLTMLRRTHTGEDPDLVYAEEYANADHEHPEADRPPTG